MNQGRRTLYRLEPFNRSDGPGIAAVFNHFVEHSFAAYPVKTVGSEFTARLERLAPEFPVVTVKGQDGRIVGFGLLHAFHPAESFKHTAEVGYFLLPEVTGQGVGTALLDHLCQKAREKGVRVLLASISSRNDQSLAFHRRRGFEDAGCLRGVGEKFGQSFDVVYLQKSLSE